MSHRVSASRPAEAPEFDRIKERARRFALVPLWVGILITVFSAWAIYSIQQNFGVNFWFYCMTLPLLLAFSAGLAGVLVLIGVLVVQVPHFARSRWGGGKVVRALPIFSAVVVTLMGLWLCYEGAHGL